MKIPALLSFSLLGAVGTWSSPAPTAPAALSVAPEKTSLKTSLRKMNGLLVAAPALQPMGVYVGELHEQWQFPSDHLPIGMQFGQTRIASWNVLDAEYMDWVIEKNSQGLQRSLLADAHVPIGDSGLTLRDAMAIDKVLEMLGAPRNIVALQECSAPFLKALGQKLPEHFVLIAHGGEAMLVDRTCFQVIEANAVAGVFSESNKRSFQNVVLENLATGERLRIVNAHLPGNPDGPGRFEFGQYLANDKSEMATIAMGDMNFNEIEMRDAVADREFAIYSPYCTNISPGIFTSKAIDHFIVWDPLGRNIALSAPDEVMQDLSKLVDLLYSARPETWNLGCVESRELSREPKPKFMTALSIHGR